MKRDENAKAHFIQLLKSDIKTIEMMANDLESIIPTLRDLKFKGTAIKQMQSRREMAEKLKKVIMDLPT